MKSGNTNDVIYKEVVVVGNGPSGIALSYMLSGNLPFLTSKHHPDEMLSMRLEATESKCLIKQNLSHLANGLEGRSTNPISLLFDCLLKPYADVGLEMAPLIEFKKVGVEIDHVVLGKGPPGGSWHKMDPDILTLSLGSWMALPEYPFRFRDSGEKRALASTVANYYVDYVRHMELNKYFRNHAVVSNVVRLNKSFGFHANELRESEERLTIDESIPELTENTINNSKCALTSFLNYVRGRKAKSTRCNKRPRENLCQGQSPERKIRESGSGVRDRSVSFSCDEDARRIQQCDFNLRNSQSLEFKSSNVPSLANSTSTRRVCDGTDECGNEKNKNKQEEKINWLVESHDAESGETTTYSCKYLVLANGTNDVPNRLHISKSKPDPNWLFHDLRTLENHLDTLHRQQEQEQEDRMEEEEIEPVLIVGAGLSAADAIIATRARNIPVCHVFRNKLADLNRRLPENMYPEYHKVNQMMQDGGSTYPFYTAYPEYDLHSIDEASHSVILTSKYGENIKLQVSFAVVLIGSRPDLTFLPPGIHFNLNRESKKNKTTLQIDKMTHCVNGFDSLFAVGPLAGDNFVRFIPGGAFAVVSQMYRNNSNYMACLK